MGDKSSSFDMLVTSRTLDIRTIVTFVRVSVAQFAPLRAAIVNTDQILTNSRKLKESGDAAASAHVSSGLAFPVADLIQTFKPETWEDFTEEWAVSQEQKCEQRSSGWTLCCRHRWHRWRRPYCSSAIREGA